MFANRFVVVVVVVVVVVDACSLVGVLQRNTILTLAEAGLFRVRWSNKIQDETEQALARLFEDRGKDQPKELAKKQRAAMENAFQEASVDGYECYIPSLVNLPDQNDTHVVAAAIACNASLIVTENLKDFPSDQLADFEIEAKSGDDFIADTIDLYPVASTKAINKMRDQFQNPKIDPENLILRYESVGLHQTASILENYKGHI